MGDWKLLEHGMSPLLENKWERRASSQRPFCAERTTENRRLARTEEGTDVCEDAGGASGEVKRIVPAAQPAGT